MNERSNSWAKTLDFYIGIPLVLLIALGRKIFGSSKLNTKTEFKKIALLKSSAIGDTVLLSSVVKDIQRRCPKAEVTLFAGGSNAKIAEILLGEKNVVQLPMLNPWRALKKIREQHFDIFIDCDSWPRINAILTGLSSSDFKIGFKTIGQGREHAFDRSVVHSWNQHEIENYRDLARAIGVKDFSNPRIETVHSASAKRRYIVLHPWPGGSRASQKMWPNKNWIEIAQGFRDKKFELILTTGPSDRNRSQDLISNDLNKIIQMVEPKNLQELIEIIDGATAVLTVDTGVAHIAGALGRKTLVLYGPTSPNRWGAVGSKVRWLKDSQSPKIQLGFELPDAESVGLSTEEVFEKLGELLALPE